MPRKYILKRQKNYRDEDLAAAVEDMKNGSASLTSTAKKYGIPKSILSNHLNGTQMVDHLD